MASNTPLSIRPVHSSVTVLRDKSAKGIAGRTELIDNFAQQLIAIELAIPGIYAGVLKLVAGSCCPTTLPDIRGLRHLLGGLARLPDFFLNAPYFMPQYDLKRQDKHTVHRFLERTKAC